MKIAGESSTISFLHFPSFRRVGGFDEYQCLPWNPLPIDGAAAGDVGGAVALVPKVNKLLWNLFLITPLQITRCNKFKSFHVVSFHLLILSPHPVPCYAWPLWYPVGRFVSGFLSFSFHHIESNRLGEFPLIKSNQMPYCICKNFILCTTENVRHDSSHPHLPISYILFLLLRSSWQWFFHPTRTLPA